MDETELTLVGRYVQEKDFLPLKKKICDFEPSKKEICDFEPSKKEICDFEPSNETNSSIDQSEIKGASLIRSVLEGDIAESNDLLDLAVEGRTNEALENQRTPEVKLLESRPQSAYTKGNSDSNNVKLMSEIQIKEGKSSETTSFNDAQKGESLPKRKANEEMDNARILLKMSRLREKETPSSSRNNYSKRWKNPENVASSSYHTREEGNLKYCFICEISFRCRNKFFAVADHADMIQAGKNNPYVDCGTRRPSIPCDICRVRFPNWAAFEKHALSRHNGVRMMDCDHCERKFLCRKSAINHTSEKRSYEAELGCKFCNSVFERSDILEEHGKLCGKKQLMKATLKTYTSERKPVRCPECQNHFPSTECLQAHYKLDHPRMEMKSYPRSFCEKSFSDGKSFGKHLNISHAHEPEVGLVTNTSKEIYPCPHCDQAFISVRKYHGHSKEHPGKAMFSCHECGNGFVYRHSLRQHVDEKHGSAFRRKICCAHCSKFYSRKQELQRHEAACKKKKDRKEEWIRRGLPTFRCVPCDEDMCMLESSFRAHKSRHKSQDFCNICKKSFYRLKTRPNALEEHMRMRHPTNDIMENVIDWKKEILESDEDSREFITDNFVTPITKEEGIA